MTHDYMVSTLIEYLSKNSFRSITADIADHEKPLKISWKATGEGCVPDVVAFLNQRGYIFEVETADTLSIQHTIDQCRLFSAFSQEHGYTFCVVVPKISETTAQALLKSIGITADVWTIA